MLRRIPYMGWGLASTGPFLPLAGTGETSREARYFPYIDGLRALAVLSVFAYHLHGPLLPGGFVGVDVFFVISGFIVSSSVADFRGRGFVEFLGYFYARRIKRIFPALIVCLLVTSFMASLFVPGSWLSNANHETGLWAFLGLSNFILASNGRDYFAPTTEFNPFTHTWSLAVEEQFYLVFPALFIGWVVGGRGKALSVFLFSAALLTSLLWAAWQTKADPIRAYYLTPSRLWELAAGVLLFQFVEWRARLSGSGAGILSGRMRNGVGGLSLLVLMAAFALTPSSHFPVPAVLPAVFGTLGVIACLHHHPEIRSLHALLGNAKLVFVGKISFSLYLWHWPVFVLFRWTCGLETLGLQVLAAGLAFLLALLSWRFVEQPVRNNALLRQLPAGVVVACGLLLVVGAFYVNTVIGQNSDKISLSTVTRNPEIWYPHISLDDVGQADCKLALESRVIDEVTVRTYRRTDCATPPQSAAFAIYTIGDSHNLAYDELYRQYAKRYAEPIHSYAIGCAFLKLMNLHSTIECQRSILSSLLDLRARLKPGDILFMPSLRMRRFFDQGNDVFLPTEHWKPLAKDRADAIRKRVVAEAVNVLSEFSGRGVHLVFEGPKPLFRAPPFRCADWFNRANPACMRGFEISRSLLDERREPILQAMAEIGQQVPGVTIWDPFPVLCPDDQCNAWRDGKPLFFDGDHLSSYGNRVLLSSFSDHMQALFQQSKLGKASLRSDDEVDPLP